MAQCNSCKNYYHQQCEGIPQTARLEENSVDLFFVYAIMNNPSFLYLIQKLINKNKTFFQKIMKSILHLELKKFTKMGMSNFLYLSCSPCVNAQEIEVRLAE